MAIARLICIFTGTLVLLSGCRTPPKAELVAEPSPTPSPTPMTADATLEALAQYYDQQKSNAGGGTTAPTPSPTPQKLTGRSTHVGRVLMVNEALKFVLVDVKRGYRPPTGALVICRTAEGEIGAKLRVSEEQRREHLAADITEGLPSVGESVIWLQ